MITIYRYSNSGFQANPLPKWYLDMVNYFNGISDDVHGYIKELTFNNIPKVCPLFELYGCFAFIGQPNIETKKYYLNHLPSIDLDEHIMVVPNDLIVYINSEFTVSKSCRMTIKEAYDNNYISIYIPKSSLDSIL